MILLRWHGVKCMMLFNQFKAFLFKIVRRRTKGDASISGNASDECNMHRVWMGKAEMLEQLIINHSEQSNSTGHGPQDRRETVAEFKKLNRISWDWSKSWSSLELVEGSESYIRDCCSSLGLSCSYDTFLLEGDADHLWESAKQSRC